MRHVFLSALALSLLGHAVGGDAHAQAMKNVTPLIEAFGKTCVPPEINMETFGKELWQARGLIVADILMADGPGESLMGFVFDTDGERFRATFPEFAAKATIQLPKGWKAARSIDMTHFKGGNMQGSEIARPMLLCTASRK